MKNKSTMLACEFGITTQAAVNNLMPVLFVVFKDNFGLSYEQIGLKIGLGCAAVFPLLMALVLIFSGTRPEKS